LESWWLDFLRKIVHYSSRAPQPQGESPAQHLNQDQAKKNSDFLCSDDRQLDGRSNLQTMAFQIESGALDDCSARMGDLLNAFFKKIGQDSSSSPVGQDLCSILHSTVDQSHSSAAGWPPTVYSIILDYM
jgi:hypothetical protein